VAVRRRPDYSIMEEQRGLHRIEDELGESWLGEWLEQGLATLEAYLAKHAAFVDYLETEPG
jgi:hypothetical protein